MHSHRQQVPYRAVVAVGWTVALMWAACVPVPPERQSVASRPPNSASSTDDPQILRFKQDPVANHDAARWFASLPLETKRNLAPRLGQMLLQSSTGNGFVFGMGGSGTSYTWVIIVDSNGLRLSGGNEFSLINRNDEHARGWGVYWTNSQRYETLTTSAGPLFQPSPPSKGQTGSDLWIPASGWKYVGPDLPKRQDNPIPDTKVSASVDPCAACETNQVCRQGKCDCKYVHCMDICCDQGQACAHGGWGPAKCVKAR